jgi:uncharacterized protein YbgA (DUF1722 family)/uncharacterized protein YbbK (DUF523 family)
MEMTRGPLRVGVSACLLGHPVRYDGGDKRCAFLTGTLARFIEFVAVCPEVELGLGVPRETLRLERRGGEVRLIANQSALDYSDAMRSYAHHRLDLLGQNGLSGYVLKKGSPSCGVARVAVQEETGTIAHDGRGLFAEALIRRWPRLPVVDEDGLADSDGREHFIERIFAYRRLSDFLAAGWSAGALVEFHTAHKLILMAHSPPGYRSLGRIVGESAGRKRSDVAEDYSTAFVTAMAKAATPARHSNALQHAAGYLRPYLDAAARREIADTIDGYRRGTLPLAAPLTRLRESAHRFGVEYLKAQLYIEPDPREALARSLA